MKKIIAQFVILLSLSAEVTHHVWNDIPYSAKTGSIALHGEKEAVTGHIFYTAYTKDCEPPEIRPITFCFNGGPGSASVWLHMGVFGPARCLTLEEGASIAPPYQWIENRDSLIDISDLVFIDPVGTGFSRAEKEQNPAQFWGVGEDLESISHFIRTYLTENNRWASPKYLAGESYGSARCSGLADMLQNQHGIFLNGMILISSAIDFNLMREDSPLSQIMKLPTYAATAWHYNRIKDLTFDEAIQKSKDFAFGPYANALFLGKEMDISICKELAYLTGISLEFVQSHKGRISMIDFKNEFFSHEDKILGLYDTSCVGVQLQDVDYNVFTDPSVAYISGIFTGTWNSYLQNALNHSDIFPEYKIVSMEANMSWNYPKGACLDLKNSLKCGMVSNPELKIFVAGGYFDLVTPFAAGEYLIGQLPIFMKDRVVSKVYKGGHLFYLHPSSLHQFHEDLVEFYKR